MTADNGRGQYLYGRRVRSLDVALGRVYESHGAEGQPALLQVPTGESAQLRFEPVQVLVTTYGGQGGVAVEVQGEPPAQGIATGAVLAALEAGANLLDAVAHQPDVAGHLSRVRPRAKPEHVHPRPARLRWLPALAAAAGLALVAWPWATRAVRGQAPQGSNWVADSGAAPRLVAYADVASSSTPAPMTIRRRIVMPDGPLEGQDTPPCGKGYVVIRGGCWAKLEARAPDCPDRSVEHAGGCYLPVKGAQPVPVSVGRGRGP